MSIINQPLLYAGSLRETHLCTLYNYSACLSCINQEPLQDLETSNNLGRIRLIAISGLSEETIIGADTLQKWPIKLNFEQDVAIVNPKITKMQLI